MHVSEAVWVEHVETLISGVQSLVESLVERIFGFLLQMGKQVGVPQFASV